MKKESESKSGNPPPKPLDDTDDIVLFHATSEPDTVLLEDVRRDERRVRHQKERDDQAWTR